MARIYTPTLFSEDYVVSPEHFNLETKGLADQWNRSLDGNNVPAEGIDSTHFLGRTFSTDGDFKISRGQFSDYYSGWDDTPWTVNLRTSTIVNHGQWNEVDNDCAVIQFSNLKEGSLYGDVIIDWERRRGHESSGGGAGSRTDDIHWTQQFAVFFDGKQIFETGPIFPRRYTFCLPFYTNTSAGAHRLDVRFQVKSGELPSVSSTYNQPFTIHAVGWHVRNLFR